MPQVSLYIGEPSRLLQGAKDMHGCLEELNTGLQALSNVQTALGEAVVSQHTGGAIQNALGSAWSSGNSLARTLLDITDTLHSAGVNVDQSDLESATKMRGVDMSAADGSDGNWTSAPTKVNLGF